MKKGSSTEEAYQRIKNMIYFNELAPGQKIIYRDLAEKMSIGVTPLIQALKRLEHSNLVSYRLNKGYVVGEINEKEARELYQAREALETYIIPAIMRNLHSKDVEAIISEFRKPTQTSESHRVQILLDARFHLKLAEYARNDVVYNLLKMVLEQLCLKYRPEYMGDERIREAIYEHRDILKAFRERNVRRAISLTKSHITKGMDHVVKSLKAEKVINHRFSQVI